jgi:hypothetical protein
MVPVNPPFSGADGPMLNGMLNGMLKGMLRGMFACAFEAGAFGIANGGSGVLFGTWF